MLFSCKTILITALCLASQSSALPRPAGVTWSVVDVDGSDASTPAVSVVPTTIFQTVTASSVEELTSKVTVSVTIIGETVLPISASAPTQSSSVPVPTSVVTVSVPILLPPSEGGVVVSQASLSMLSTFSTSVISSSPSRSTSSPYSRSTSSARSSTSTSSAVTSASPATVTLIETYTATPSASSTPLYDDGMWHTYYPVKDGNGATSSIASSTPAPCSSSMAMHLYSTSQPTLTRSAYGGGWNTTLHR